MMNLEKLTCNTTSALSYQHIRNATAKIQFAGSTFLVDPYLAPAGSYPGFEGTLHSEKRHPLINLNQSIDEILQGVDAVILTHTHEDHWDEVAQDVIPKDIPIFVQNSGDAKTVRMQGFKDVRVVGKNTPFGKVKLTRIVGQHGTDFMYAIPELAERLGDAMGVVFKADNEKTLYIVGDTLWNEQIDNVLKDYQPEIIVMNTGYARLINFDGGIIMGFDDVAKMRKVAPKANIITVHMDAVNHTSISSDDMRKFIQQNHLKNIAVPTESEIFSY